MRKQTKIAAVVSAAALLALGASITSFAAAKGTWMLVDGEWYCYDKNGDVYENTFCSSNGKEYYVGEDGMIVKSDWVEYDGDYYFVNSSGQKITNDWRLTTPYDDEDADEEWYYFQSTGKMANNKKIVYKNKTYYFDTTGKMLTGWVTVDGTEAANEANDMNTSNTYYCDETGARVQGLWVYTTEPGTEEDDADADEYWYFLKKSTGKVQTGRAASVNGQTFFFDTEGKMLTGWVGVESGSNGKNYVQLYKEDEIETPIKDYFDDYGTDDNNAAVYYCGYSDDGAEGDGHAKKNTWRKLWKPEHIETEEADDLKWFYFNKDGKLYVTRDGSGSNADKYKFNDGVVQIDAAGKYISKKKVNSKDYWFDADGAMVTGFYLIGDEMYYFGGSNDGVMKTGSQSIKDDVGETYKFYFRTKDTTDGKKGSGVTGNQNNKLYYYGFLLQADEYKYQIAEIEGHKFIINANGSIQHGNVEYKEDGDVLISTNNKGADGKYTVKYATTGQYKYSIEDETGLDVSAGLPNVDLDGRVAIN